MSVTPTQVSGTHPRIATCLHGIAAVDADGRALHDAGVAAWAGIFAEVADLGFDLVELPDSHVRLADLDPSEARDIFAAAHDAGIAVPSVHIQRRSILTPGRAAENLDYAHRSIDAAAAAGIEVFSTGLHQPFTDAQRDALWFWTVDGPHDPDDRETWDAAVSGLRELGRHAADVGLLMSLELYEDTLLGSADSAVRLIQDIGLDNVGLNPDVGNLIRLHRPVEDWREIYAKTLPYANYWHLKNYNRDEAADGSWHTATPSTLEAGLINYRQVVRDALAGGFDGIFLMEHYGGDSLGMCRTNADYLRTLVRSNSGKTEAVRSHVHQEATA